jgi:hypothetical protein
MIEDARYRIDNAEFFLGKMRSLDRSPNIETTREFQCYFSAFLMLARAPLQILCLGDDWTWVNEEVARWDADRRVLYKLLSELRNATIHVGKAEAEVAIEMVAEAELPQRHRNPTAPRVYMTLLPGQTPPKIGVATYNLRIGNDRRNALECCTTYLELVRCLVDRREGMAAW